LNWESVTWDEFEGVLREYRKKFFEGEPAEEKSYINVISQIGHVPLKQRANPAVVREIIAFLNKWKCRFSPEAAIPALSDWIRDNAAQLETFGGVAINRENILNRLREQAEIYYSLLSLKSGSPPPIHNMSDAAASKILHVMQPAAFVMWDRNIERYFRAGYHDFLEKMHKFARKLDQMVPAEGEGDAEAYVNGRLAYPIRKTLAKFIDEYNWHLAAGRHRVSY
jgi:hypothetical protein